MMQISHEVPLCVLQESENFNDYDYCLLHLTYEYEEYKKYYQEAVKKGRKVLLDNSIFELGDALTLAQVAQGVEDIHPTWVVVPDCLDDKDTTIKRFKEWENKYSYLDVKTIGVVQGQTIDELIECYKFMSEHADKIAISFDSKAYCELTNPDNPLLDRWCEGRQLFIQRLVAENIWDYYKPHHLLGCSLAREFSNPLYNKLNVETIDTSNPVVAAIHSEYYGAYGLSSKPTTKLCDLITHQLTEEEEDLMYYNIQMFRYICGVDKKWITFFSQTGSEIANIIQKTGKYPYCIFTTNKEFSRADVREKFKFNIVYVISKTLATEDYIRLFNTLNVTNEDFISLHGYLRIVPPLVCDLYNIYNLHPGLITKYPELKGKDPQEKAFNKKLEVSGVVIHEVVPEVDSGKILLEKEVSIKDLTLDEVYDILHSTATEAWIEFFTQYNKKG